ncbi:hypothetical protein BC834DRAFT_525470 [Gloeopeniophorella convolvens]|nr:hypothetical protein BC834DRAFT_525470 [Gloeopeniophorella convolvens]
MPLRTIHPPCTNAIKDGLVGHGAPDCTELEVGTSSWEINLPLQAAEHEANLRSLSGQVQGRLEIGYTGTASANPSTEPSEIVTVVGSFHTCICISKPIYIVKCYTIIVRKPETSMGRVPLSEEISLQANTARYCAPEASKGVWVVIEIQVRA